MRTAEVKLSDEEHDSLQAMSKQTGKSRDDLLHEAVHRLIEGFGRQDRQALLRQACGMWKDRHDLLDFPLLRKEWDRF